MHNRIRGFAFGALLAALSTVPSFPVAAQQVPQQLQPPANEKLLLQVHAKGDQAYTCKSDAAQFTWTLKAPDQNISPTSNRAAPTRLNYCATRRTCAMDMTLCSESRGSWERSVRVSHHLNT